MLRRAGSGSRSELYLSELYLLADSHEPAAGAQMRMEPLTQELSRSADPNQ
jgi:hypothetical protein